MRQQDYLDVSASTDRQTLEQRLVAFANRMDFGLVSAALAIDHHGGRPFFTMIGNTPDGFLEASRDPANVARDPVVRRMRTSTIPFTYDQTLYVEEGAGDLWESFAPFGYKTGIAMSLHMPGGKHFLLGVDRPDPLPSDDFKLTRMLADLQLLAAYAQEAAVRVLGPEATPLSAAVKLTVREREVLKWTRDGKSAWAVGEILGMSEVTVRFHLRNVATKLGVSGKHLAVLKAMSLGLI
jgi:DNA-binding CsgD family transcriptional regulator